MKVTYLMENKIILLFKKSHNYTQRLLFLFLWILNMNILGQNVPSITPTLPPSPQSEAFKQFGDYSINYSTGVPDISILLFEIDHRGYKLPLKLRYSPSPLKPGYNYDVFGFGWGLSVNSSVSRTINYGPDENNDFKIVNINKDWTTRATLESLQLDVKNYGYDDFNAVFPDGSSVDFYIERVDAIYKVYASRPVKITPLFENSGNSRTLQGFSILDENGVKFTFNEANYNHPANSSIPPNILAWHLTQIDLPNSKDPIVFTYQKNIQNMSNATELQLDLSGGFRWNQEYESDYPSTCGFTRIPVYCKYNMLQLENIHYGNTSIEFNFNNNSDVSAHNYVNSISITSDTFVRNIKLKMHETKPNIMPLMLLDTVEIINPKDLTSSINSFTYDPVTFFYGGVTDHWGYLNYGYKDSISNFKFYAFHVPDGCKLGVSLLQENPTLLYWNLYSMGNNKREPFGNHGTLKSIKYPTGGYTEFTFERHEFLTATDENGYYILDPKNRIKAIAPGFRIREISNFSENGKLLNKKNFRYGKLVKTANDYGDSILVHSGLGLPTVDPNIFTYLNYEYHDYESGINFLNTIYGDFSSIPENSRNLPTDLRWHFNFSSLNFRRLLNGRPQVLYPEVTVYYGGPNDISYHNIPDSTIGRTVYKFDVYNGEESFFETPMYFGNTLDYIPMSYRYNNLIEKSDYNNDGKLLRKEINYWSFSNISYLNTLIYSQIKPYYYYPPDVVIYDVYDNFFYKSFGLGMPLLTYRSITTYTSNDSTITYENYNYNKDGLLSEKEIGKSNGDFLKSTYKYPNDYTTDLPDVISEMKKKNIISSVIVNNNFLSSSFHGVKKKIGGEKIDYKIFSFGNSSIIMPFKIYSLEINSDTSFFVKNGEIKNYTINGNPLEYISKDSIHTCYIWGYDDRYMVASIVNASYNENGDIISGNKIFPKNKIDAIRVFSGTNADLTLKLNEIRSELTTAMVTTYTYIPFIGMDTQTDPNGVKSYFDYDNFGRLKIIKDDNQFILKTFDYHYLGQSK